MDEVLNNARYMGSRGFCVSKVFRVIEMSGVMIGVRNATRLRLFSCLLLQDRVWIGKRPPMLVRESLLHERNVVSNVSKSRR